VAVVASLEANEALKLIVRPAERSRKLLSLDVWDMTFEQLEVARDPACPCCAGRQFPYLEAEEEYSVASLCGRDAVQIVPRARATLDLAALESRLAALGPTRRNAFLLEAEVEGALLTVFPDGRALVGGVQDPVLAQGLYARYVGH
jgi:adenylyltransferase/sulfurtransferase